MSESLIACLAPLTSPVLIASSAFCIVVLGFAAGLGFAAALIVFASVTAFLVSNLGVSLVILFLASSALLTPFSLATLVGSVVPYFLVL